MLQFFLEPGIAFECNVDPACFVNQAVTAVIPCVKELATDSSQYVRASLASVVMELAPVIGKQATTEHLLPSFLSLLKDIYPDVRLNVISNLDQINQVSLFQKKSLRLERLQQ